MRRAKRTLVILSLALASCRGPVLAPTTTPQVVSVRMLATTSTYPLLQDFAEAYRPAGLLLGIDRTLAGWDAIYAGLLAGDVPYALTTILPAEADLWAAQVGWDGIAVVVHADNAVPALSLDELRLIFQGRVASWRAFGGPDLPVTVVSREPGAATQHTFSAQVMRGAQITGGARLALSCASVIEIVAREPGAVGFVSMAFLDERVHAVALELAGDGDPVPPTLDAVSRGTYPLRAPLLVIGLEPPAAGSIYRDWFAWMQSAAGQQVVGQRYGVLQPRPGRE